MNEWIVIEFHLQYKLKELAQKTDRMKISPSKIFFYSTNYMNG